MWNNLSIASKLIFSLVLVVVLGFSALVFEQWSALSDGLHTQGDKNRASISALLSQNIGGAVRWKKAAVIEKAYEKFVSDTSSDVSDIVVTDLEGALLTKYVNAERRSSNIDDKLADLIDRVGDGNSLTIQLADDTHTVAIQKVLSPKDDSPVGYIAVAFSNENLASFVQGQVLTATMISIVAIVAILVATFFIVCALFTRPMKKLIAIVNDLANGEGDLTQRLEIRSNDELGALAGHINTFLEKLQSAVSTVVSSAAEVRDSLGKARSTADENRALLNRQSTELGQAASSIQAMSKRLDRMSDSAQGLAGATADARTEAEVADQIADDAVSAVTSLTSRMEESEQVISSLRDQSDSIGSVLGVIEGIAEQTNLLALNAAIEAARAGEQGRGFAVVADEVRTLASRTQQSTEEIKGIIDGLQNGAQNAVHTMEQSQSDVSESASRINRVKQSLAQIVNHMERITATNSEVTEEIVEQSNVASGVSSNIDELNNLSTSILDNGISTAKCCEQSSEMNDKLNEQVAFFKV